MGLLKLTGRQISPSFEGSLWTLHKEVRACCYPSYTDHVTHLAKRFPSKTGYQGGEQQFIRYVR